jgi:hypothetical protein
MTVRDSAVAAFAKNAGGRAPAFLANAATLTRLGCRIDFNRLIFATVIVAQAFHTAKDAILIFDFADDRQQEGASLEPAFSRKHWAGDSRLRCNRITVPLPDHANGVAGAINDDGKEVHDVPAEHTHIKRFGLGEAGEGSLKSDGTIAASGD